MAMTDAAEALDNVQASQAAVAATVLVAGRAVTTVI